MRQLTFSTIILFSSIAILFSACMKQNPDASWIKISNWTLESNQASQNSPGELTMNVKNVRITIDGSVMGIFEVPCKLPILKSGMNKIILAPVILNNGIAKTKKVYPFLEKFEVEVDLVQNDTIQINPTTRYLESLQFKIEDFENPGTTIIEDASSSAHMNDNAAPSFLGSNNGLNVGEILLSETNNFWLASTQWGISPTKGEEVYLELDCYNTNHLETGVLGISGGSVSQNPNIRVNAQEEGALEWKKIYIDLKEIIANSANVNTFEISFLGVLDDNETAGEIYIDNVKVVHF